MSVDIAVKELLEAGVHFGHQTRRWNPKMRPYIFTARDGIHIIDLEQTANQAQRAYKFIADTVALGNSVLFVGTKKQAQDIIESEARRSGQFFVTKRWLGGMLTNFQTIKQSITRLNDLEARKEKGELENLLKKEALEIEREIDKLEYSLGGIKTMTKAPGAVFLIDPGHEEIAKKEAIKLGIPVVALIDTNSNPDGIDYLIAGNDDAIRSIGVFAHLVSEACLEGGKRREAALREQKVKEQEAKTARPKGPAIREQKIGGKGKAWVARRDEKAPSSEEEAEKFASAKAVEQTSETSEKSETDEKSKTSENA
ncbi:MAG: 30S ribosomal protein S2 [Pseudomonadota bacterium]